MVPSRYVPADQNFEDVSALINPECQVSITEHNEYIINFPSGIVTDRYYYMEELDMIAYTSADVLSQYSTINLSLYGENSIYGETDGVRKYMAMHSNGPFNTGMRLLMQISGPGVTTERVFV